VAYKIRFAVNPKQRENLAKYSYDISKIVVALLVLGPLTRPEQVTVAGSLWSVVGAIAFLLLGLALDYKEKKP